MKIAWGRSIGYNLDLWKDYYKRDGVMYQRITGILPSGEKIEHKGKWWLKMNSRILHDGAGCYPWREYFALIPRKTITGKRIFWCKAYKRRVWIVWGTGFHMEPAVQYGTVFDILETAQ